MSEDVDISKLVTGKSDQLNADDLLSGAVTIKITKVKGLDDPQQPLAIHFEGDNGKPYKPCLSMRRVLSLVWGGGQKLNGSALIGRYMTLRRDKDVMFGGLKVGGIRISHMSNISETAVVALTAAKGRKIGYEVKPLKPAVPKPTTPSLDLAALIKSGEDAANNGMEAYKEFFGKLSAAEKTALKDKHSAFKAMAEKVALPLPPANEEAPI